MTTVYEGVWYNHDAQELVLTLSPTAAGFLAAALVTFVHLVAVATWPIWRYILYSIRQKTNAPPDVFHAQRQVMLRNSNTAANAAAQLLKMMFGYRSYKVRAFLRSIVYLVICIAIFLLWTICGLYAPYIYTRTSGDVLLAASPYCGIPQVPGGVNHEALEVFDAFSADTVNGMTLADTYVQQCYGDRSEDTGSRCISYPTQSLNLTTTDGGECPFTDKAVCQTVNSTVITMDTGLLDSNRDFGINTRRSETLQYRRVSTCSPIHTTGYVKQINTTGTPLAANYAPGEQLVQYLYGPEDDYNFTYQYETFQSTYPIGYTTKVANYIPGSSTVHDGWVANTTFYDQTDGDVSLVFLAGNSIKYPAPVYDPFFAAGLSPLDAIEIPYNDKNLTFYTSTRWVTVIGCKEQHQFCLAGSEDRCTPLSSINDILNKTEKLEGLNVAQLATAGRIGPTLATTSIAAVILDRGPSALLASRTLNGLQQLAILPMDQWRKEVINWKSIALARMQALVLAYAAGPANPDFNKYVEKPSPLIVEAECKTQRVRDPHGYVNFDMAGLIILVVVGAGLVFLGFTFEMIVGLVSKLSRRLRTRREKWLSEGLYHLHKETLQAHGVREWQSEKSVMPRSMWSLEQATVDDASQAVSFLHVPKG